MGAILGRATQGSQQQIRYVTPVGRRAARGLVERVYHQAEQEFGLIAPPLSLHSPAPGPLAASWLMLRETLIAAGGASRATKEAVAAAVSLGNACPYCVEVHSATLHGLARHGDATAIAEDRIDAVTDPRLREIAVWARASGTLDGAARPAAPLPAAQIPELVGVAVTFQYLNRMVEVFLPDSPLPPSLPLAARGGALRMVGWLMRPIAGRHRAPGLSLPLLPDAPLPEDLAWADGNPGVAGAFARAAAAVEAAGHRSVPAPVRDLVGAALAGWDGHPSGPSSAWTSDALAALPIGLRPAGHLALLMAMAPYQVSGPVVERYRQAGADDETLVEFGSWVSLAAARRVGGWLHAGLRAPAVGPAPVAAREA